MISEVVFYYALSGLIGIFVLCGCKKNEHPSLKGEPITPLPGDTPSAYFKLPTNQSAYGSVMQDPKDSKDSKDKETTPKKAEKSNDGSVSKDGAPKESKKDDSKTNSQLKDPRKKPSE